MHNGSPGAPGHTAHGGAGRVGLARAHSAGSAHDSAPSGERRSRIAPGAWDRAMLLGRGHERQQPSEAARWHRRG
jgi:hypothetical protein